MRSRSPARTRSGSGRGSSACRATSTRRCRRSRASTSSPRTRPTCPRASCRASPASSRASPCSRSTVARTGSPWRGASWRRRLASSGRAARSSWRCTRATPRSSRDCAGRLGSRRRRCAATSPGSLASPWRERADEQRGKGGKPGRNGLGCAERCSARRPSEEDWMDKIIIEGGVPLRGTVRVSGAKNAALPAIAASLLAEGEHLVSNVPDLADVRTMGRLLAHMGCEVARGDGDGRHAVRVSVPRTVQPEAPYDLVRTMRASVVVLGPLVARWGRARVSLPGGCAIGARPIDQHLKGLAALGAEIRLEHGYVEATAPRGRLHGAVFTFDGQTVTGTENVMMAAALAEGRSVLRNCAREPEVADLAAALVRMGARIEGAGTDEIRIEGVRSLRPLDHFVIPDRIEAGTFLVVGALPGGDVTVRGCIAAHLEALIEKLRAVGAEISEVKGGLRVVGDGRPRPVDVRTAPHPGFPTDMQAQLMVLLCLAHGSSKTTETVFENRFMHVQELQRLGADIAVEGKIAIVKGVPVLSGAPVMASDLRASAALVLAALAARG